jgi:hypothetical protein
METEIAPDLDRIACLPDQQLFAQQASTQERRGLQFMDTGHRMPVIIQERIIDHGADSLSLSIITEISR